MNLLQLIYCGLITYGPSFIVYRSTKLLEFNGLSLCIYSGLGYGVTQVVKMILLATFLPTSESEMFDFSQELLKALVGIIDIIGLHYVLKWSRGSDRIVKILGVGLGWGTAESILFRLAPVWLGAKGMEFDWSVIYTSIEANISLLGTIGLTTMVWLWGLWRRKNLSPSVFPLVLAALLAHLLFPLLVSVVKAKLAIPAWSVLLLQLAYSVPLALAARYALSIPPPSQQHKPGRPPPPFVIRSPVSHPSHPLQSTAQSSCPTPSPFAPDCSLGVQVASTGRLSPCARPFILHRAPSWRLCLRNTSTTPVATAKDRVWCALPTAVHRTCLDCALQPLQCHFVVPLLLLPSFPTAPP
eukprot:CAMPEP_0196660506 /NCGR_PEP_ID=MMETSP1086-20130531/40120_1 /TAXON_ID=77921 /ORGANISM="Cyanoptyche  gloeocystis , Strain SAG4.97" /LENGTH=354 /DNA_ID=CAMNT_0041994949 /DNA_START=37 /DNA_END=1098 /DNA_ORIENTATION=+